MQWANGRQMTSYNGTAFTYDGLGRRLSKGSINYTYDSNGRIIKQSNGIEFIYDNSGVAGIIHNGATYVYRKDGQGNICALIDSSGNIVVQYKYDAWGDHVIVLSDASNENLAKANPFRYRGYYYDEETGLYYLKTRYYDPETGRFITIDDISYIDPETINGLNLYAYCGNNPVMRVDANGNKWWHWLLGGLLIVAITIATVVTAGAAAAILGAGAAVVKGVMVGAAIGGLLGGGFELIGQGLQSNWQSLDFGALAIETFMGAAYGAISGAAASTTSAGLRLAMRGARVALSGVSTMLHGINNGDSWNAIWRDSVTAMIKSGATQLIFFGSDLWRGYTTTANIMAIAMDKTIRYGIKEMCTTGLILMGKSLWRFFGDDILNAYKNAFSLIFMR